ncbi:MAG: DUF2867 domain-containing protein [Ramlibacter sp.]
MSLAVGAALGRGDMGGAVETTHRTGMPESFNTPGDGGCTVGLSAARMQLCLKGTGMNRWIGRCQAGAAMKVVACGIPAVSVLDRGFLEAAWFQDAYRVPLRRTGADVADIFIAIFAHHPLWMKRVLMARNRLVSWFGLEAASAAEMRHFEIKHCYRVGENIGVWPIFCLTATELVAGRDNGHLDFRLSVCKLGEAGTASVVVSTVCVVHNCWGKLYLLCVIPFHKWGLRRIMANAVQAERL